MWLESVPLLKKRCDVGKQITKIILVSWLCVLLNVIEFFASKKPNQIYLVRFFTFLQCIKGHRDQGKLILMFLASPQEFLIFTNVFIQVLENFPRGLTEVKTWQQNNQNWSFKVLTLLWRPVWHLILAVFIWNDSQLTSEVNTFFCLVWHWNSSTYWADVNLFSY